MAKNKIDKKELKKQAALEKAEKNKRKEAIESLKPLFYSFALWGALMGIIYIPAIHESVMDGFVSFVVKSTVIVGSLLFLPVESQQVPQITVAGYNMRVIFECTAYNFYLFSIALVVFARWNIKDKLINFGIFVASIFVLNAFRFIVMGYVGKFWPQLFHQIHDYVWTIVFGLVVFILYIWRNDKSLKDA